MGETLLIINGRILTMAGKVLPGGCVLIENGKIAAVTDQIKIPEGRDTEVIDASGCLVMPGLVEAHCHVGITEEKKGDRKSTRLNSSHITRSRMPSSA